MSRCLREACEKRVDVGIGRVWADRIEGLRSEYSSNLIPKSLQMTKFEADSTSPALYIKKSFTLNS